MPVPQENEFWKIKARTGPDRLFATPEALLEAAEEYFAWVDTHPLYKYELLRGGDTAGEVHAVPLPRPYTLNGFQLYINVSDEFWFGYKHRYRTDRPLMHVMEYIERAIRTQKFEGASAGLFNANFIARDLGMADRTDMTSAGKQLNGPQITINMPPGMTISLPNNTDGEITDAEEVYPAAPIKNTLPPIE